MKYLICVFTLMVLGSCMVVDPSHFRYLDEDSLEFNPVLIKGAERDVEISLPKSLATQISNTLSVDLRSQERPYTKVLDFPYEWLWGGPINKDVGLYLFELGFEQRVGQSLQSISADELIQVHRKRYEDFDEGTWREIVLERLKIVEYQSNNGNQWLLENMPTVKPYHEVFSIPVSEERELVVWFWYNEDWAKDNPEWYERRKALSRRILDTVKLSEP